MTMITPERTPSAAKRLLERMASHESEQSFEEKKSMDEGDLVKFREKTTIVATTSPKKAQPVYRNMVSNEPGSKFLPESGRYVLYVSRACPSSHCALMTRTLKGLEDAIAVQYVRPNNNKNWILSHEIPDDSMASFKTEGEFQTLRDVYAQEHDTTSNTIPLLYDLEHQCIVNNNANEIALMLNSAFSSLANNNDVELFPNNQETELDEWLYPLLELTPSNVPPYHYNLSARPLEFAFARATSILQKQRYLLDSISIADLRLFAALIRYDAVYAQYLECPPQLLHNRVLMDYCRDIYQLPGVADTISVSEIQKHFLGTTSKQSAALLPLLEVPHKRALV